MVISSPNVDDDSPGLGKPDGPKSSGSAADSVRIAYSAPWRRAMHFRHALLLCVMASALADARWVRAEDRVPSDPQTVREVDRLVRQLDADTRGERAKARDGLLTLGPKILSLLPEDRTISSAEARQSLHEIRLRLQQNFAIESLRPSRLTLNGTFPLRAIFSQVAAKTGNQFDTHDLGEALLARNFTVDFDSRSFWSACDEVTSEAGIRYGNVSKGRLRLIPASHPALDRTLAVADDGAFRVAVNSATIRYSVVSKTGVLLRVVWSVRGEPRLRPLFARIYGRDLQATATDNRGPASPASAKAALVTLRPISPAAKLEISTEEGRQALRLSTDFEFPARMSSPRIDFGGSFTVEMAAGPTRFVFDDLMKDRSPKRVGNVVVRLREVEIPASGKAGDARVEISVAYDQSGPAFESYRTWLYHNELWLESRDGRRLLPQPRTATRWQDDGALAVEYNFAGVTGTPAGYGLVYVAPTLVTQSPVQFQLRNIPTIRDDQGEQP
jgi:hypothetical protein